MKEEHTTYIYWDHKSKCVQEYGVYSETQVVFEDIRAPLFHNILHPNFFAYCAYLTEHDLGLL